MRLLMVTSQFAPAIGGIQTYSAELAAALHDRVESLTLVAPKGPGTEEFDRTVSYEVVRMRARGEEFTVSGIMPIGRLVRRRRFDAAFCTHWAPAHAVLRGSRKRLRRIVCAAHGVELVMRPAAAVPPAQAVYDRIRRHVFDHADLFTPVSRFTARMLGDLGVEAARIETLPNGVDPARFHPVDATRLRQSLSLEGCKVLLTVARLVPRKGIDRVIEVLSDIANAIPQVRYVVVGDGPDRDRLQDLAQSHDVADRIIWTGGIGQDDILDYYSLCDLFVMPSSSDPPDIEGFGLVFLEAGACGKPVIGSTAGGIPDAVRHGETGLLVDVGDREGLLRSILRVLSDDTTAQAMGSAGRARAEGEASWNAVAGRLLTMLQPHR